MKEGKFITFEGCEGVGKSRQLNLLTKYLDEAGVEYVLTREPGGTPIAEKIREVILSPASEKMTRETDALLFAAARAEHMDKVILPALAEGKLVLCDRFIDSSYAYQAYAGGLGMEYVEKINEAGLRGRLPDATVFLDLSPREAFLRKGGADKGDRIEGKGQAFHERVYEGYRAIAERFADRFIVIDPRGTKEETHAKIVRALILRGVIEGEL